MIYLSRQKKSGSEFTDRQMERETDCIPRASTVRWYVAQHESGGKLGCRSSYLSKIITGILAARWVDDCSRRREGSFGIWKCKLVVTSGHKLLFKTCIKTHLTQIVTDAFYQHTWVTVTWWMWRFWTRHNVNKSERRVSQSDDNLIQSDK